MTERIQLTPKQAAALRALREGIVELSTPEVAVSARLLPTEAREALTVLEKLGLATLLVTTSGRTGDDLYALTDEGQAVSNALVQMKGTPSVGAVLRTPHALPSFLGWLSRQTPSYVEIVADDKSE